MSHSASLTQREQLRWWDGLPGESTSAGSVLG